MTILNSTPFPLFLTYEEVIAYLPDVAPDEMLSIGGHRILPIRVLAPDLGIEEIHEAIRLTERENVDALRTVEGELRFEYACTQLETILALSDEQRVRAWDVVPTSPSRSSRSSPSWTQRRRQSPRSRRSPDMKASTSARSMASRTSL